jgi:hypothetical protein
VGTAPFTSPVKPPIRLAAFDIGFDVERGHQPNFVPELPDLARPVMGGSASFHADEARGQLFEERQKLRTPDRSIGQNGSIGRDAMDLKNVLGQIQSNCRNLHRAAPFLADDDICILAHRDAGWSRSHPPHPFRRREQLDRWAVSQHRQPLDLSAAFGANRDMIGDLSQCKWLHRILFVGQPKHGEAP